MGASLNLRFRAGDMYCERIGDKIGRTNKDGFGMGLQNALEFRESVLPNGKYPVQIRLNLVCFVRRNENLAADEVSNRL